MNEKDDLKLENGYLFEPTKENSISFQIEGEIVITISKEGVYYKEELSENSKDVAEAFRKFLTGQGFM